jgi:hypothetical protein
MEKLTVSDLKEQLKQRGLPTSGPKSQLIERLKNSLSDLPSDYNVIFLFCYSSYLYCFRIRFLF